MDSTKVFATSSSRPKNIVVCCDGTNNDYSRPTNVFRLFATLPPDDARQVAFYECGIGAQVAATAFTKIPQAFARAFGLMFGYGALQQIASAYQFLVHAYDDGDRVFLFGFSRGGYVAIALAALLHSCGLLHRHNAYLIPSAIGLGCHAAKPRDYIKTDIFRLCRNFRQIHSQVFQIHFVGLWDAVSSIGWLYNPITLADVQINLPYTGLLHSVKTVRHALSIDERRRFYRPFVLSEHFGDLGKQDIRQVWFAGTHSDVGGGHPESRSGLSQVALQWMLEQAEYGGLIVDLERKQRLLSAEPTSMTPVHLRDECSGGTRPSYSGPINPSLKGLWWVPELLPRRVRWYPTIPFGERRTLPRGAIIHQSVVKRCNDPNMNYHPRNLPASYQVEPSGD